MSADIGHFRVLRDLNPFLGHGPRDVKAYVISYPSGDLTINGWLYEPADKPMSNPSHPIDRPAPKGGAILAGHGGVWGIPVHYDHVHRRLAKAGWTVVIPSYRGEDGSDGEIEFTFGEVDDTIACGRALSELDRVDPEIIWLIGSSHGAMVNLHALATDDGHRMFRGTFSVSGVYDLPLWLDWLNENDHILLGDPDLMRIMSLDSDQLAQRSVIKVVDRITRPVMLAHGGSDSMVPVEQTTALAGALRSAGNTGVRERIEPGSEHEYIWAPERPDAVATWTEVMDIINPD